ncbi:flavodoxin family protein [Thalassotalea sp. PS06]|uniref:flavodoxin family protein n=1 Tax=Thalassotalea sp. PS06 TaxID=2594005 RepID=UPI00163D9FA3
MLASSHANGNTGRLARQVAKDIKAPIIDINDFKIRPYCYDNLNQNDGSMELVDLCLCYQQIVFASPVYWY